MGREPIILDALGPVKTQGMQPPSETKPSLPWLEGFVNACYTQRRVPDKYLIDLAQTHLKWKREDLKGKSKYDVCRKLAEVAEVKELIPPATWEDWKREAKEYVAFTCKNDTDYISQEEWSAIPARDLITIYQSPEDPTGICYRRSTLVKAMKENPVFRWTGPDGSACCPDKRVLFYHLPLPNYWIDEAGFNALERNWSNKYDLSLVTPRELIGTEFAASSLHGFATPIYTMLPRRE